MSRVQAVVDRSIMVHLKDVVANDILSIRNDESDPIIEEIEFNCGQYRLHYKSRTGLFTEQSAWLDPTFGPHIFVHDLKNERADFEGEDNAG